LVQLSSGFKCEWLCPTSTRNEGNVGYIREGTHIPDALRFWVKMWHISLLLVLGEFSPLSLPTLPGLPQQLVSEPWLGSVGGQEWDPSLDQASGVGDSHLRGRLLGFTYEWLCPTSTKNEGNVGYIYKRGDPYTWCLNVLDEDVVSKSLIGSGSLVHYRSPDPQHFRYIISTIELWTCFF